ncbi:unnamed protein product [Brachionus calyciflorus]|uniref:Endonuclease/exonuclease/phosphatase domain-containing protein n=1 Tax=Brachionus calyciflorus TaxID=104777 RepID=A0A814P5X3_9BILA|nr:unnamed protein product [Brachionus calyciflorus]
MKMNKTNEMLNILHACCQSILNQQKIILIEDIISKNQINILCLNETFLKPSNDLTIKNFNKARTDRKGKRGGGVAIGILKNIEYKIIKTPFDVEAIGIQIKTADLSSTTIFSYYSIPKSDLNFSQQTNFLNFIFENYPNSILIGDLNAKHSSWNCKYSNIKEIAKSDQIELEAENIRKEIQKALTNSTINYQINIKCEHPRTIPKELVQAIKYKNKMRRLYQMTNSIQHKKLFNMIERKIKKELKIYTINKFEKDFEELEIFNQNNPKHWKLIDRIDQKNESNLNNVQDFKISDQGETINDEGLITDLFSKNIFNTFNEKINTNPYNYVENNNEIESPPKITTAELKEALKKSIKSQHRASTT